MSKMGLALNPNLSSDAVFRLSAEMDQYTSEFCDRAIADHEHFVRNLPADMPVDARAKLINDSLVIRCHLMSMACLLFG